MDASVKIGFHQGLITEWYPRPATEVFQKSGLGSERRLNQNWNGIDTSLKSLTGTIEWRNIKVQPDTSPALPVESAHSRYYAARETDAAPVAIGDQHEKFLFYRGVARFPVPLNARLSSDGKVVVQNGGADPVPTVILFENHGGRVGYRNAGLLQDSVAIGAPSLDSSIASLCNDLETALTTQGLFSKEAHAMVETWRDSWFQEGSRLIYIVPAHLVDSILPLQVDPTPSFIARVFVGRIELMTPETRHAVEQAMLRGDRATIERYGRFLDPILRRISSESPAKAKQIEQYRRSLQQSLTGGLR